MVNVEAHTTHEDENMIRMMVSGLPDARASEKDARCPDMSRHVQACPGTHVIYIGKPLATIITFVFSQYK